MKHRRTNNIEYPKIYSVYRNCFKYYLPISEMLISDLVLAEDSKDDIDQLCPILSISTQNLISPTSS